MFVTVTERAKHAVEIAQTFAVSSVDGCVIYLMLVSYFDSWIFKLDLFIMNF